MTLIQKHVNGRTDLIDKSGHCVGAIYYGNPDFNLVFKRVPYHFDSLDKALRCAELLSGLCFAFSLMLVVVTGTWLYLETRINAPLSLLNQVTY